MNQNDAINAIKFLGIDMINKANSGHPGIVLGAAPIMYTLFTKHIKINVDEPNWVNRDRFILSAGHGSALLYAILHLIGVLSLDDIKRFRQKGSNTPGHPEFGHTKCVDMTTGPLGQGISTAVGMAIAQEYLSAKFNISNHKMIDNYTYVLCGDGDIQEGITQEALSLAGHLKLNKLIIIYDSNDIQLDGPTSMAYSENAKMKYEAIGFNYIKVDDGNDVLKIDNAICDAKLSLKPTIIEVKTKIGNGTTYEGTCKVHGAPIGIEEAKLLREKENWPYDVFEIPNEIYEFYYSRCVLRGKESYQKWQNDVDELLTSENRKKYQDFLNKAHVDMIFDLYSEDYFDATRNVCAKAFDMISQKDEFLLGGAADLTKSAMVKGMDGNFSSENRLGRNICYGVREHAMGAIENGIVLYGLKSFCAGFFVFSDYLKPAMRLSALMNLNAIYIFSHDSIAVGEDGPTHQPIEQLAGLRSMPNMNVMRPCDANETLFAVKYAYESKGNPSVIVTTRQKVRTQKGTNYDGFKKGAYIISPEKGSLDGVLLSCGSEIDLAIEAQKVLEKENIFVRVVSMPSMYLFEKNDEEYKKDILPNVKTLAIEMGSTGLWYKYAHSVMGIDTFGISAPMKDAFEYFKFTTDDVVRSYKKIK